MKNERGVTLIELMIVVAIIGILAALAAVAYERYVTSAKIEKLRQYATEVASGQERFRSRNNVYWNPPTSPGTYTSNTAGFNNLLDFTHTIPPEIVVTTEAWNGDGGGTCTICQGASFDDTKAGFAVAVEKDFKAASSEKTTIIVTNITENPVLLWEGE